MNKRKGWIYGGVLERLSVLEYRHRPRHFVGSFIVWGNMLCRGEHLRFTFRPLTSPMPGHKRLGPAVERLAKTMSGCKRFGLEF